MKRVVITGLGFITSIGNSREEVLHSLQTTKTGVERYPEFIDDPTVPVSLVGTVKGFGFPTTEFEDWTFPPHYKIARETLRPMAPNTLFAYFALRQAIEDARSCPPNRFPTRHRPHVRQRRFHGDVVRQLRHHAQARRDEMPAHGHHQRDPRLAVHQPRARVQNPGASLGFSSACSSSAHALGHAVELIRSGRQKTVFVVGAEDCDKFSILPFAAIRALSVQTDPEKSPCAFDKKRDGFVGTGGAAVLVVEALDEVQARGADDRIYAEVLGWGQASDGYNVLAPDPAGDGLTRTMRMALADAKVAPGEVEYINAHATSTPFGDQSEIGAIKAVFAEGRRPLVSSTKSLTGHGLSLAGAMEAGFCCLTLKEGFVPVSAHITELDPVCEGVPVITEAGGMRAEDRDEQFERVRRHERFGGAAEVGSGFAEQAAKSGIPVPSLVPLPRSQTQR